MTEPTSEKVLKKANVDQIFSLNKTQWSEEAKTILSLQILAPGWELRVTEYDTGDTIVGFNPANGVGLAIQPFFRDDTRPPGMLRVGNYFPVGMLPPMKDTLKKDMEVTAQKEIGAGYSVHLRHSIYQDKLEMVDFLIIKLNEKSAG